ncbi:MAG: hypothetical protein MPK62_01740 [Alphaproteobacteria bacterium]|nr:hypothetical protein [Alphaproteobacteria bacterium]MDA8029855.1 hypothetical protein [Alphaproteobacteria bacterium]
MIAMSPEIRQTDFGYIGSYLDRGITSMFLDAEKSGERPVLLERGCFGGPKYEEIMVSDRVVLKVIRDMQGIPDCPDKFVQPVPVGSWP